MHELYELKTKLCDELEKYAKKDVTSQNLEYIDKLAHAIKNIDKILEASDYSGSYARAYTGNLGGYRGMHDGGMSYANRNRDAMGRYSSDSMLAELRELRKSAPDDRTRMEFDRFIQKMETM